MENISEKDLYKFVFYPEDLDKKVYDFIKLNFEKYKSQIDLLQSIKSNVEQEVSDDILDKIYKKIDKQTKSNEIILEKIKRKSDIDYLVLAADSEKEAKTITTDTFTDLKSNYIGKIINNDNYNKIFIFSKQMNKFFDFSITLYPSKDKIYSNSNDQPILIQPKQNITKIKLEIN
ncbi:MAG: hypothetical protein H6610_08025 [Ignavibacteriales bacterium]|nr:hypothetical protein [Ignavibacteriales bacterium]MCB9210717.1 hypothetical protein [Ignavibacteriales bacterium]MCB9219388.1 hypothetical protein [Ignavibacteriales bacterium]MCB9259934.1 hypothetical protein [Ignavibacteriales bacterium]